MQNLLSILVPIYNHNIIYVEECINSIVNMKLSMYEVLLINNGATKESKDFINYIIKKDKRFRAINFEENVGYSNALNKGIEESTGTYIGIVESDDSVTKNGFYELMLIADKLSPDIVKGTYNEVLSNDKNFINKFKLEQFNKILSKVEILKCSEYILKHMSHWSAIYKKSYLLDNGIFFEPKIKIADIPFTIKTWMYANSLYIISTPIINYRRDNENSSLNQFTNTANDVIAAFEGVIYYIEKINIDIEYKNKIIFVMFASIWFNYHERVKQDRLIFLKRVTKLLNKANSFAPINQNKYFTPGIFTLYKSITGDPFIFIISEFFKYKTRKQTLYFKGLLSIKKDNKTFAISILKQHLYRYVKSKKFDKHYHFLFNIFSIKYNYISRAEGTKVFYFLKKPLIKMKFFDQKGAFFLVFEKENYVKKLVQNMRAEIQAPYVHSWIKDFQNRHDGEDIACVACGPSIKFYKRSLPIIHLGVNRAFLKKDIKFDYLLCQDFLKEDQEAFNNYNTDSCIKFYGKILDERLYDKFVVNNNVLGLMDKNLPKDVKYTYILSHLNSVQWATDPILSPIADFGGSVFSALQFLAYTHPKRIYLIGCDCSVGDHFYGGKSENFSGQIGNWKKVKTIFDRFYPEIEIVSINPIGLKGLFKDMYTKEFLEDHPEIKFSEENKDVLIL